FRWFDELVQEGANTDFIAQQISHYLEVKAGSPREVVTSGDARALLRQLQECATAYDKIWKRVLRQLGESAARRDLNPILISYLQEAAIGIQRVRKRLPAKATRMYEDQLLDVLQAQLVIATGTPQHRRLGFLMSALDPAGGDRG